MGRNNGRVGVAACSAMISGALALAMIAGCSERTTGPAQQRNTPEKTGTGNSGTAGNADAQRGASTVSNGSSSVNAASPVQVNFKPGTEQAMFGAGCFWGVEHIYRTQIPGVIDAVSGYAGGRTKNPTYEEVCSGTTGHVEVVLVTFDTGKTNYDAIVDAFFRMHDPTQVNRQGPDIGEQYRSVIYYYNDGQRATAEAVKARRQPKHSKPIATTVEPAPEFYKAEEYHQKYYIRKGTLPYCHTLRPD